MERADPYRAPTPDDVATISRQVDKEKVDATTSNEQAEKIARKAYRAFVLGSDGSMNEEQFVENFRREVESRRISGAKSASPRAKAPQAGKGDFGDFVKLANGTLKPEDVEFEPGNLMQDVVLKEARKFMSKDQEPGVAAKIIRMKKDAPNLSDDEASAISTWISNEQYGGKTKYATMNRALWDPDRLTAESAVIKAQVDVVNRLAVVGLHKLPSITVADVQAKAAAKNADFDPNAPLQKHFEKMPPGFADKYRKALAGDGLIREETFFGTTHLAKLDWVETGSNVTVQIKPKWDGTGQGKYIDHFKNGASEGEIMFPPQSAFKVNAVRTIKKADLPIPPDPGPAPLGKGTPQQQKAMQAFNKLKEAQEEAWDTGSNKSLQTLLGKKEFTELQAQFPDLKPTTKIQNWMGPDSSPGYAQLQKKMAPPQKIYDAWEQKSKEYGRWMMAPSERTIIEMEEV
jgi:hypothetical protein